MPKPINHTAEYMRIVAGQAYSERVAIPAGYEKQYTASSAYRALVRAVSGSKREPIIAKEGK